MTTPVKPKVLLVHPDAKDPGGVASFFRILEPFESVDARHFVNGRRPHERGFHFAFIRLVGDYLRFGWTLLSGSYDVVHINPSMDRKGVMRDAVFMLIAGHMARLKTVVFFHGWDVDYAERLRGWRLRFFRIIFRRAETTLVLARDFKETLITWGFSDERVIVETTAYDEALNRELAIEQAIADRRGDPFDILFLARLVKAKGLYEAVETFAQLAGMFPRMRLIIAGDGEEHANVKSLVERSGLAGVVMPGYLQNRQKIDILIGSSVFFLPSYSEGLPISLIEAMAMGLPVVTRSVGGVKDFFVQRKHGFTTESKDPRVFAEFIIELHENQDLYGEISRHNYAYAKKHFAGSQVRRRMELIYKRIGG